MFVAQYPENAKLGLQTLWNHYKGLPPTLLPSLIFSHRPKLRKIGKVLFTAL
jgi:hypothetical protein